MLVEEVMTTELVTCEADATLPSVAERMVDERVGSVLVYQGGVPSGIITETDLIRESHRSGRSFEEISATEAMSSPLVTIEPDRTLRKATEHIQRAGVKKLPVSAGLEVVGIVTLTDVVYHYTDLKQEIHRLQRRPSEQSE